jgi:hypothetical protein
MEVRGSRRRCQLLQFEPSPSPLQMERRPPDSLEREIDNSPTPTLGAASIPPFRQAGFRNFRNRSLVIMRGVVEKSQSRACGVSKIDNI